MCVRVCVHMKCMCTYDERLNAGVGRVEIVTLDLKVSVVVVVCVCVCVCVCGGACVWVAGGGGGITQWNLSVVVAYGNSIFGHHRQVAALSCFVLD